MGKTILTSFQQKALQIFKRTLLSQKFYLSGGTALAEFYLYHRFSEDLDFFTSQELSLEELEKFMNLVARENGIKEIDMEKVQDFFLSKAKELKPEIIE